MSHIQTCLTYSTDMSAPVAINKRKGDGKFPVEKAVAWSHLGRYTEWSIGSFSCNTVLKTIFILKMNKAQGPN